MWRQQKKKIKNKKKRLKEEKDGLKRPAPRSREAQPVPSVNWTAHNGRSRLRAEWDDAAAVHGWWGEGTYEMWLGCTHRYTHSPAEADGLEVQIVG